MSGSGTIVRYAVAFWATMLALSVLPVACFAAAPVRARIGGLFQDSLL
jgi:hypothetical protein